MSNTNDWGDVEVNIKRHESGCWTWIGPPLECNVYRFVAEAYGAPLPNGHGKLYRMPCCTLGRKCVNPNHIGSRDDYMLTLDGRRRDNPEPLKTATGVKLTHEDRRFLKTLRIRWE
jgi:hypothetical protein